SAARRSSKSRGADARSATSPASAAAFAAAAATWFVHRSSRTTVGARGGCGASLERHLVVGTSDGARTRRTGTASSDGGAREWNEAERVLFAETLLLFPLALGTLRTWWLVDHPETAPYLDPHVL